jgi:adenine-specific DNA-methyltransferase
MTNFKMIKRNCVVLRWPGEDGFLIGGQDRGDQKREERIFNSILESDEIDRLLERKVLTKTKRYDKNDVHKVTEFTLKDNLLIKGNNLLALYSLVQKYRGKVKLIYIDPPYNTGSDDFKYNDRFNHSAWLTFMKNRLEIAKELLTPDGSIFVQCDESEHAYLKVLMDEVFGRENYKNTIIVESKKHGVTGGGKEQFKKNYESILFYCKNKKDFIFKPLYKKIAIEDYLKQHEVDKVGFYYTKVFITAGTKKLIGEIDGKKIYEHKNFKFDNISAIMRSEDLTRKEVFLKYYDSIFSVSDSQLALWKKINELVTEKGKLISAESGTEVVYVWNKTLITWFKSSAERTETEVYKKEGIGSLWKDITWGRLDLEGGVSLRNGKKPEKLLQRIIEFATNPGDIVLDFFAGSGTTGAVAHKIDRRWIMVEQLDYKENGPDVRMNNVIQGDQSGISKDVDWKGGGSFISTELLEWNEKYVKEIQEGDTTPKLLDIYNRMKKEAFFRYEVDLSKFEIKEFEKLPLEDQKKVLLDCLDMNHLYVNLNEIDDTTYEVSGEDKKFNKEFYKEEE